MQDKPNSKSELEFSFLGFVEGGKTVNPEKLLGIKRVTLQTLLTERNCKKLIFSYKIIYTVLIVVVLLLKFKNND